MFRDMDLNLVLLPLVIVLVAVSCFVSRHSRKESDPMRRTYWVLKMRFMAIDVFLAALWFCLPSTPSLSTFGHPDRVEQVMSPDRLLHYMQRHNRALVRTTQVLHWFILAFAGWFLTQLTQFAGIISAVRANASPSIDNA